MDILDEGDLARLLGSDWAIKRLRSRLLAYYLSLWGLSREARRRYIADASNQDSTGADYKPSVGSHRLMPSWNDVLKQMFLNDASLPYLTSSGPDDPHGEEDGLRRFKDQNLQKFVDGEPRESGTHNAHFHFTVLKPMYKLQAVAAFLIDKGFLDYSDLSAPHIVEIPARLHAQLSAFGLEPKKIHQDRYFRGDYSSEVAGSNLLLQRRLTIQTSEDALSYVFRVVEHSYKRGQHESAVAFEQRVAAYGFNARNVYSGCSYFAPEVPMVVVLEPFWMADPPSLLHHIPAAAIDAAVDWTPKLPGGKELATDVAHRLSGLVAEFVMCKANEPLVLEGTEPIALCENRNDFERFRSMHQTESCGLFYTDYRKQLAPAGSKME